MPPRVGCLWGEAENQSRLPVACLSLQQVVLSRMKRETIPSHTDDAGNVPKHGPRRMYWSARAGCSGLPAPDILALCRAFAVRGRNSRWSLTLGLALGIARGLEQTPERWKIRTDGLTSPTAAREGPKTAKRRPRRPKDGLKTPKRAPKSHQDIPKGHQDKPTRTQDGPMTRRPIVQHAS